MVFLTRQYHFYRQAVCGFNRLFLSVFPLSHPSALLRVHKNITVSNSNEPSGFSRSPMNIFSAFPQYSSSDPPSLALSPLDSPSRQAFLHINVLPLPIQRIRPRLSHCHRHFRAQAFSVRSIPSLVCEHPCLMHLSLRVAPKPFRTIYPLPEWNSTSLPPHIRSKVHVRCICCYAFSSCTVIEIACYSTIFFMGPRHRRKLQTSLIPATLSLSHTQPSELNAIIRDLHKIFSPIVHDSFLCNDYYPRL
ncbi:hypothetical protein F5887DRAFT_225544 [Amanita rubescens]|nr:hypothetical protein F5887DRAFT_225544 [Amanita rubescens]